jgi:hypothetical protein
MTGVRFMSEDGLLEGKCKLGNRMLAIMLVFLMVAVVASPIITTAKNNTHDLLSEDLENAVSDVPPIEDVDKVPPIEDSESAGNTIWAPDRTNEVQWEQSPSMWKNESLSNHYPYERNLMERPDSNYSKFTGLGKESESSPEKYPLNYSEKTPEKLSPASKETGITALSAGSPPIKPLATGGPDLWGYVWEDSNAPAPTVPYFWNDISATGINSSLAGDDSFVNIPIGFNFNFYGNPYNDTYVSTNGLVSFGIGSTGYYNDPIPSTNIPNNIICPFWDDLWNPGGAGSALYYETIGVTPNQALVIQYNNWDYLGSSPGSMFFQVILNETGEIWTIYNTITDNGLATVGIENSDASSGLEYSYNTAGSVTNLEPFFTHLSCTPTKRKLALGIAVFILLII